MNIRRLVSLAAALAITATEWAVFSTSPLHAQSAQAVAAPVASDASNTALPVITILAGHHA